MAMINKKQIEDERTLLPADAPFTCLGHDNGNFYFLIHATNQVINLRAERHKVCYFFTMAPLSFWERSFPAVDSIGRHDWQTSFCRAADALIGACYAAGVHVPECEVIYSEAESGCQCQGRQQ